MPSSLHQIIQSIAEGKRMAICGAGGSSRSYLLALLRQKTERMLILFTDQQRRADELYEELTFFNNKRTASWNCIRMLPQWGTLPYKALSPSDEISSERISLLAELAVGALPEILIIPAKSLMQKVIPVSILKKFIYELKAGDSVNRDEFLQGTLASGYTMTSTVERIGDCAVHGGILDIFSPSCKYPYRIEFDGDTIYSMRTFDPETQRSISMVERLKIIPPREGMLSKEMLQKGLEGLKLTAERRGLSRGKRRRIEELLISGGIFPGREYFLPYFTALSPIFDYLPEAKHIAIDEPEAFALELKNFWQDLQTIFDTGSIQEQLYPEPQMLYLTPQECLKFLDRSTEIEFYARERRPGHEWISLNSDSCETLKTLILPSRELPFERLAEKLKSFLSEGWGVVIVLPSELEIKRLLSVLLPYKIEIMLKKESFLSLTEQDFRAGRAILLQGPLRKGFMDKEEKLLLIGESDIFGEKKKTRQGRPFSGIEIADFGTLKEGDFVVHEKHGIGIYKGLEILEVEGKKEEFLIIEYQHGDKLYAPVFRLKEVQKYRGVKGASPVIHKLGSPRWQLLRKGAERAVKELASTLLRLYARRKALPGFAFPPADEIYNEFESTFPHEETPDQSRAISEVMTDMESACPMDRLVCGDVGFGKTEIAIRAAFKAIMAGKQVALLVPTTLLAYQHFQNFSERFRNYPIEVRLLSRFRSNSEIRFIIDEIREGKADMVIGTHRLLKDDVLFKDLGLLIIDEEHRFGVWQKEKIKRIKEGVDVLVLTATPIPRTLQMSLSGIRDMSVIYTPPPDRHSIRTYISYFNDDTVRDAILLEKMRGGQVFYIHNEIHNIEKAEEYIKNLVPEIRCGIVHGRMDKGALEEIMVKFINRKLDLLVCTSIIASGLDIPSANTLLVNNAHMFGLTDLYQLRGRIGRSTEIGYAYFMIPEDIRISEDSQKRLRAVQEFGELGSGFKLALRDMEIRGAGELLGIKQSGHICNLGFDIYSRLLEDTVRTLRGESLVEEIEPEIQLGIEAYIPSEYIPDAQTRLEFYKKLALIKSDAEIPELREELLDRFGKLPEQVENLLGITQMKNFLTQLGILSLLSSGERIILNMLGTRQDCMTSLINALNMLNLPFQYISRNRLGITYKFKSISELNEILKKINKMLSYET